MRIEWAIACYAITADEGRLVLTGPAGETSGVEDFPESIDVPVAVCLVSAFSDLKPGRVHSLAWTVLDPYGAALNQDVIRFRELEPSAWHHPGWNAKSIEPWTFTWMRGRKVPTPSHSGSTVASRTSSRTTCPAGSTSRSAP